jgi:D-alanyl-D-alanine carboxypeptidase
MQLGQTRRATQVTGLGLALALISSPALANPALVVDASSGQVLIESQPTANWYPASLTKLMTVYVALQAMRAGRVTMDTPFVVSSRAANMPPSKMGFRPGVQVTLDNALKMLMVKSPNDVAVTVAEGVSGSVEAFADEMNAAAAHLGLKESHFVNPNGLPDARQMSSARDMAMVARALIKEFPEENDIFGIGALQLGDQIIQTHNGLIGHYPGADGMKTGFTCAAGFNVVASATHGGRRLIVVILGSSSARERTAEAEALFDRAFAQWGGGQGSIESLPSPGVNPAPDMHQEICSRRGRAAMAAGEEEEFVALTGGAAGKAGAGGASMYEAAATAPSLTRSLAIAEPVHFDPVPVFIGPKPGWTGPVMAARAPDGAGQKAAATNATTTPVDASAYAATDKPQALDKDQTPALSAPTAPMALQGALKPLPAALSAAPGARHMRARAARQSKPRLEAAAHSAAAKPAGKVASDPASAAPAAAPR